MNYTKHSVGNGNGTGDADPQEHGSSSRGRLVRLLNHHEKAAASLRFALSLLDDDVIQRKVKPVGPRKLPQFVAQAVAREAAQGATQKPRPVGGVKAQRQRSATMLATFSRTTPQPWAKGNKSIGSYVRRGYLVRKGDGYVRTAKEYIP